MATGKKTEPARGKKPATPARKTAMATATAAKAPVPKKSNGTAGLHGYFAGSDTEKATGLFQLLGPSGTLTVDTLPARLDRARVLAMYEGMLRVRIMDERLITLQRQGRIGFYGEARGQEATVIGMAAALAEDDWIVPALREAGVGLYRGLPLDDYIAQIFGNQNDPSLGRQMPCHPCGRSDASAKQGAAARPNYVVMSSVVSTQIPHAVGIAMGMKIRGHKNRVVVGFMGDGGTSEGDFHAGLNFAGVFHAPVVLVCQNNQWAISTPGGAQTAAETIALKGLGYGVESLRVDGNDVLAVYEVARYAYDKARRGDGPTFVEALTYRVSAHSSSDDPSRYRDESVTDTWKQQKDPIQRARRFLFDRGWLDDASDQALAQTIDKDVRDAVARQEQAPAPALPTLVQDVFEDVPWHLREQLAGLQGKR